MFVNADYMPYVPWFIFFAGKAYPEYSVRIYSSSSSHECMNVLNVLNGLSDWKINSSILREYHLDKFKLKCIRWLLYPDDVQGFENIYIGDIDMAIFREFPSLLDFHLSRCRKINLPYSNRVRHGSGMQDSDRRLMGVHFARKEWFSRTASSREIYISQFNDIRNKVKTFSNEGLLFDLAKNNCGLPPIDSTPKYDYHGIHLGMWRQPITPKQLLSKYKYSSQISRDQFLFFYDQYCKLKCTSEFRYIWKRTPSLHRIFSDMEKFAVYLNAC